MDDVPDGPQRTHAGPGSTLRQYVPEEVPSPIERHTNQAARLYGPADRCLPEANRFAAGECSIADIAIYPWLVSHTGQGQSLEDFPNPARCWYENIAAPPAADRALEAGSEPRTPTSDLDGKARDTLFGNRGRAGG